MSEEDRNDNKPRNEVPWKRLMESEKRFSAPDNNSDDKQDKKMSDPKTKKSSQDLMSDACQWKQDILKRRWKELHQSVNDRYGDLECFKEMIKTGFIKIPSYENEKQKKALEKTAYDKFRKKVSRGIGPGGIVRDPMLFSEYLQITGSSANYLYNLSDKDSYEQNLTPKDIQSIGKELEAILYRRRRNPRQSKKVNDRYVEAWYILFIVNDLIGKNEDGYINKEKSHEEDAFSSLFLLNSRSKLLLYPHTSQKLLKIKTINTIVLQNIRSLRKEESIEKSNGRFLTLAYLLYSLIELLDLINNNHMNDLGIIKFNYDISNGRYPESLNMLKEMDYIACTLFRYISEDQGHSEFDDILEKVEKLLPETIESLCQLLYDFLSTLELNLNEGHEEDLQDRLYLNKLCGADYVFKFQIKLLPDLYSCVEDLYINFKTDFSEIVQEKEKLDQRIHNESQNPETIDFVYQYILFTNWIKSLNNSD